MALFGFARLGAALLRLIVTVLTTPVGRIILGSILLIGGIAYGVTSHTVTFQPAPRGSYKVYYDVSNGNIYFNPEGSKVYYVAHAVDFQPWPDPTFFDGDVTIASILTTGDAQNVNVQQDSGNNLEGTGYRVVYFSLGDSNNRNDVQTFTTTEYQQHQNMNSYYDNRWPVGSGLLGLGLLLLAFTFISPLVVDAWKRHSVQPEGVVEDTEVMEKRLGKILNKQRSERNFAGSSFSDVRFRNPPDFKKMAK